MTKPTYYKVLVDGRSCNGGNMPYSLPTEGEDGWKPGDWHEVDGELQMCSRGLHLTSEPARWWQEGAEVYEAEYQGQHPGDSGDKICCRKVRLVRRVEDLSEVAIYGPGEYHEHRGGHGVAWGNSTVKAWGNSTVKARGNSTVEARDNSTVKAWDNSTVKARGNSTVEAWGNSTVKARGNSTVKAWDNSTVKAWGNSTVKAWGNSTVKAWDNSTVNTPPYSWNHPTVKVVGHAVWIDRSSGEPVIHAVTAPEIVTHPEDDS